jgi:hypothetical protein
MSATGYRTTISVNKNTKSRLDKWRAPGQCYDGFLLQIIELWENTHHTDGIRKAAGSGRC